MRVTHRCYQRPPGLGLEESGRNEEQLIGKHFREVAQRGIPDKFGTDMRKEAADYAHQDYMQYVRSKR